MNILQDELAYLDWTSKSVKQGDKKDLERGKMIEKNYLEEKGFKGEK